LLSHEPLTLADGLGRFVDDPCGDVGHRAKVFDRCDEIVQQQAHRQEVDVIVVDRCRALGLQYLREVTNTFRRHSAKVLCDPIDRCAVCGVCVSIAREHAFEIEQSWRRDAW
jgi:hypothetical protein